MPWMKSMKRLQGLEEDLGRGFHRERFLASTKPKGDPPRSQVCLPSQPLASRTAMVILRPIKSEETRQTRCDVYA